MTPRKKNLASIDPPIHIYEKKIDAEAQNIHSFFNITFQNFNHKLSNTRS